MRPSRELARLHRSAIRRLLFLKSLVDRQSPPVSPYADRIVAFVVIEAVNLWAMFSRSFYLSCIFGATRMSGGRIAISRTVATTKTAGITYAVRYFSPKKTGSGPWNWRDEPDWKDPSNLLKLLMGVEASNLTQAQTALSHPTDVFKQLPIARNFFAHRNKNTMTLTKTIARSAGLSTKLRPSEILVSTAPGRPQNLISDCLDDIRNIIDVICE